MMVTFIAVFLAMVVGFAAGFHFYTWWLAHRPQSRSRRVARPKFRPDQPASWHGHRLYDVNAKTHPDGSGRPMPPWDVLHQVGPIESANYRDPPDGYEQYMLYEPHRRYNEPGHPYY